MKTKFLYGIVVIFLGAIMFKVVTNSNKKRGLNKNASDSFIRNFDKLVGTKKMESAEKFDQEVDHMIESTGGITDVYRLNVGDSGRACKFPGYETDLKTVKMDYIKLKKQCDDEGCDELDLDRLETLKTDIATCITQNELDQETI